MLKQLKLVTLHGAEKLGVTARLLNSNWRARRLLIVCFHGISLHDEHKWSPELYMSPEQFRQRCQILRDLSCTVLPLHEAVHKLHSGSLPPRSVVITFDDGTYDFYTAAAPVLKEFGYPATVYLTSFYSYFNRPVFNPMCSYLLWKAGLGSLKNVSDVFRRREIELDGGDFESVAMQIRRFAARSRLSAQQKDDLLTSIANSLELDYQDILRRRLLHIMTASELREIAAEGFALQPHTHRHRVPRDRALFRREIAQNCLYLSSLRKDDPAHFCYPSGVHSPKIVGWLKEMRFASATTCEPGLATPEADPLRLPRLVDTMNISELEFRAWCSGLAALIPHRAHQTPEGGLNEDCGAPAEPGKRSRAFSGAQN